ncbi:uncharacterized protein N7459_003440 [Penicillium hispanicum]|uniref:uncharacterized protein n=1 Tax=Penicillium hispanicum TaxID=1080232 RepID=UPI00254126A7|nr:uncharacterized protein N7459_003440 [Penicillium hispanicum]KAJ5587675.1 hypothetical protein N7459_003440 [Penicillium hispanicum]
MAGKSSKASFFAALEQLDYLDDSQDEYEDPLEHLFAGTDLPGIINATASAVSGHPEPPMPITLPRANSEPQPSSEEKETQRLYLMKDRIPTKSSESTDLKVRGVKRSQTTGAMLGTKSGGLASKKRKRANSIKVVPEEQQIFKNLVFFFFPNNDVSPSRRLRIQRVQEYGGQWAREWTSNITHVVVDKGLLFQDLIAHLKLESFPTNLALVNESYPSDCIRFRSVISPTYARFRVDGMPLVTEDENPTAEPAAEPSSAESLQVKPSRREQRSAETSQSTQEANALDDAAVAKVNTAEQTKETGGGTASRDRDALDDVIDETRAVMHLPLDIDDFPEEESNVGEDESENESVQSSESDPRRKTRQTPQDPKGVDSWTLRFACMQKFDPDAQHNNPNSRTIDMLQQMLDYYTRTADHWRTFAYRKAINALRRQTEQISTRTQALNIPGIGSRLADKIEEIVLTDHLRQLDHTNDTPEDRIIQEFLGIYGVGLSQASKWVAQGYRSLGDLLDKAPLTKNQRIGVERYHDFAQRIPRKEVEAHGAIVRQAVQTVDSTLQVIIAGSYRRGAPDSGDIDLLITKPDASLEQIRSVVLDAVVPQLFRNGFLQVGLATSQRHDHDGSKWHGASALPGSNPWRRIDLLFVPGAEFGAALIYFTGNDIFNRSMRLLARKKGLCLNQRGLWANVLRNARQEKINPGRLVEGRDERRIFELLGVPWRPPEHRIC